MDDLTSHTASVGPDFRSARCDAFPGIEMLFSASTFVAERRERHSSLSRFGPIQALRLLLSGNVTAFIWGVKQ
jgi:hypothetical protein